MFLIISLKTLSEYSEAFIHLFLNLIKRHFQDYRITIDNPVLNLIIKPKKYHEPIKNLNPGLMPINSFLRHGAGWHHLSTGNPS